MLETAVTSGYIKVEHLQTLNEWRQNPSEWGK